MTWLMLPLLSTLTQLTMIQASFLKAALLELVEAVLMSSPFLVDLMCFVNKTLKFRQLIQLLLQQEAQPLLPPEHPPLHPPSLPLDRLLAPPPTVLPSPQRPLQLDPRRPVPLAPPLLVLLQVLLQVPLQVLLQAQLILIQLPAQLVAQSLQDLQLMLVAALVIIRLVVAVMATPSLLVVETNVSGFQMVPFPLVLVQQEMVNVLMHLTMDQITAAFLQLAKVAVPLLNVVSLKTQ